MYYCLLFTHQTLETIKVTCMIISRVLDLREEAHCLQLIDWGCLCKSGLLVRRSLCRHYLCLMLAFIALFDHCLFVIWCSLTFYWFVLKTATLLRLLLTCSPLIIHQCHQYSMMTVSSRQMYSILHVLCVPCHFNSWCALIRWLFCAVCCHQYLFQNGWVCLWCHLFVSWMLCFSTA